MTVIKRVSPKWFTFPDQSRKDYGSEAELRNLGENMLRNGQFAPVGAKTNTQLIYGFRRVKAALLVGMEYLEVKIYEDSVSAIEVRRLNFSENMHRLDISGYEKWKACEEIRTLCGSWAAKDLAEYLNLDPSMVTKLLSPSKCIPAWQEALKAGKVGIGDCYHASLVPQEKQIALLELKNAGASRDALSLAVKRTKSTQPHDSVRSAKITIPLVSGVKVVVSGKSQSLAELIETFAECTDAAKKGLKERLDVRTWEHVMRDKSVAANEGGKNV